MFNILLGMDLPSVQGLRACLLCGGMSRRMGRDKSLIPHPQGGSWLSHTIDLCLRLDLPVDVVSSIPSHHQLASRFGGVECRSEPFPGRGPLAALSAVIGQEKLLASLVLPVDMPWLETWALIQLIRAWQEQPSLAVVSHDGIQLQPLFAIYPSDRIYREPLLRQLADHRLSMHDWLGEVPYRVLALPKRVLRNVNSPADLVTLDE